MLWLMEIVGKKNADNNDWQLRGKKYRLFTIQKSFKAVYFFI